MRVITGKYKGRHFEVPRTFKARPTTDFAKENLFNVLRAYIDFDETTSALDLFAGTGSISLELLSRGCGRVVSVERDIAHFRFIMEVKNRLGDEAYFPVRGDVFRYVARCAEQFDFVFADPPYTLTTLADLPAAVLGDETHSIVKPGGLFVLEHGKNYDFSANPCFVEHRAYGSVNFSIFRAKE
jgi:16S rRNA (guanine966-N2)-methyltransferase